MSGAETIFAARGVVKKFRGLTALSGVDFEIGRGEILGLIGPNGAGKTTLVSLISGTLRPTEGALIFDGQPIENLPTFKRARMGIGRTFQVMKPFYGLSTLENVAVGALFGAAAGAAPNRAIARDRARVLLDFVGLSAHVDRRANELGGPDRKRLELAKALALRPRLLLLDEVMAGLNAVEVDEVVALIKKIRDTGVSILVIEHVIKAMRSLSDRLMVLHHGQQIAIGEPAEVLARQDVIDAYLGRRRA